MRVSPGTVAWSAIVAWEFLCPPGNMLCQVLDPVIARWPILSRVVIIYTALHMANMLDEKLDAYYRLGERMGR